MNFRIDAVRWLSVLWVQLTLLLGTANAESVTYYYTNQQGTPLAIADSNGTLISTADYAPFGRRVLGTPESGLGFNGHVNDALSGMVYMQARYYSPDLGRFVSVDPKSRKPGEVPSFGRYVYTNNNPTTNTDGDGRDCSTSDGMTRCITVAYDVSFRAQAGFKDFSSNSLNYHFYSTPVITANVTLAQARAGLVSQPTPGFPMSASQQGTKNDATPGIGGMIPGLYLSPVVSLTATNRLDGQPVVVNVTLGSHMLAPGVVVREAVPAAGGGVLIQSWGEGTARLQAPESAVGPLINSVWKDQVPSPPATPTGCGNNECLL